MYTVQPAWNWCNVVINRPVYINEPDISVLQFVFCLHDSHNCFDEDTPYHD